MKALFQEIRAGDVDAVAARLDADPALVDVVAKAPPKKDDGQSALQVAIKSAHFDVAELLLARGADVNFVDESSVNQWNAPVLHDAIRAAVFSARFGRDRARPGEPARVEVLNSAEGFEKAFSVLGTVVGRGADPNAPDSFGNTALMRAVLDARQIVSDPLSAELAHDLHRVFGLILSAGGDPSWVDTRIGKSLIKRVAGTPLEPLLPSA